MLKFCDSDVQLLKKKNSKMRAYLRHKSRIYVDNKQFYDKNDLVLKYTRDFQVNENKINKLVKKITEIEAKIEAKRHILEELNNMELKTKEDPEVFEAASLTKNEVKEVKFMYQTG